MCVSICCHYIDDTFLFSLKMTRNLMHSSSEVRGYFLLEDSIFPLGSLLGSRNQKLKNYNDACELYLLFNARCKSIAHTVVQNLFRSRFSNASFDLYGTYFLLAIITTGLVSISVAMGGAKRVIATDYEPLALALTRYAADNINSSSSSRIETQLLDLCDLEQQPLPVQGIDIVCAADIMYEPKTGVAMAHRAVEALRNNCRVIIGDSPGRVRSSLN